MYLSGRGGITAIGRVGALLAFMILVAAPAASQEPKGIEKIKKTKAQLPLPTIKVYQHRPSLQRYHEIVRNFRASQTFRENTAKRLFAIRATTVPPPPFDPQISQVVHGVAFELADIMGYTWATSANLVEGTTRVEIRDGEGKWHPIGFRKRCPTADLVILDNLPKSLASSSKVSATRAFEIVNPEVLREELPILIVSNIESSRPTLHLGALKQEIDTTIGSSWEHNLFVAPGTPLLDHEARVVLIQASRPERKIATAPLDGFRCADEAPEPKRDE